MQSATVERRLAALRFAHELWPTAHWSEIVQLAEVFDSFLSTGRLVIREWPGTYAPPKDDK